MKTYHNVKWNFSLDYPEDWEIVLENSPEGGWELAVGIAGEPSLSGRPGVMVHVAPYAVLNFFPGNASVGAAAGSGASAELPNTVEEYNQMCKQSIMKRLPGVQFISEQKGVLAGMASGTLLCCYRSKTGVMREKQITLFGTAVTYRLLCEVPEEQSESVERYFDSMAAAFAPFGRTAPTSFTAETAASISSNTSTIILKEGLCPTCGRNLGTITGWKFGPTTIRCKKCGTILDAHAQWKDWLSLPVGTRAGLVLENVGVYFIFFLVYLAIIRFFIPDVRGWELLILQGLGFLALLLIVFFYIIPFFRRVSESKKLSKENIIPEW
jgi:hypothetical protein